MYQRHGAVEQEVVKVGGGTHLPATLDLYIQERTAFRIDATGLVQVVKQAVHAGAAIEAGAVDEPADEYPTRLSGCKAGVAGHIGAKDLGDRRFHQALQVLVAYAQYLHRPRVGQEDIAFGINDERGVEIKGAPQADLNLVAHGHGVIGIECQDSPSD